MKDLKEATAVLKDLAGVATVSYTHLSSYTYIVQGLVIIVAVAIDIRKYLAKK